MAATAQIVMFKGEDFEIQATPEDDETADITGWSITFNMRLQGAASVAVTKSVGSGVTITDGEAGEFTIALPDSDTDTLSMLRDYSFDVWRMDAGSEAVMLTGSIRVRPSSRFPSL